jgi:membrane protein
VSFAGSVQAGFEKIWSLPVRPRHKIWRQVVWLTALVAYIYAAATVGTVTHSGLAESAGRVAVAVVLGVGWVLYGGQLFGRWFYDAWLQAWAQSRRDHGEQGGVAK